MTQKTGCHHHHHPIPNRKNKQSLLLKNKYFIPAKCVLLYMSYFYSVVRIKKRFIYEKSISHSTIDQKNIILKCSTFYVGHLSEFRKYQCLKHFVFYILAVNKDFLFKYQET